MWAIFGTPFSEDVAMSLVNWLSFRLWSDAWSALSRQWRDRTVALHGGYRLPYPGQPFVHALRVEAWVLSDSEAPCQFELQLGGRVLEIGCGTGRIGAHIAPHCRRWTGADVSVNMLRFARRDLGALGNVNLVRLNGFDLTGVADCSQDAVYCSAVFMHLDEWDRFRYVQESLRTLRPGGRLFVDNKTKGVIGMDSRAPVRGRALTYQG